jgi:hypothetical protein
MKIVFTGLQQGIHQIVRIVMIPLELLNMPWGAMVFASLVLALLALFAFKLCSRQRRLVAARDRMIARTLELYVFRHDIAAVGGIFARIIKEMGIYLSETFRPVFVALIPMILLIGHFSPWLGFTPVPLEKSSQLVVSFADSTEGEQPDLEMPEGLALEGDVFHSYRDNEFVWTFVSSRELNGVFFGSDFQKSIRTGSRFRAVYPKSSLRLADIILYPGEPLMVHDADVVSVSVAYPERTWALAGFGINWLVLLLILSVFWGLILKRPFGVEF